MIYRVCEAFRWCIPPQTGTLVHTSLATDIIISIVSLLPQSVMPGFKISLHYEGNIEPIMFQPILNFFRSLHIIPDEWTGPGASFTANTKMMRYLYKFQLINNSSRLVYHLDLDEFPVKNMLRVALQEIYDDKCDAIKGIWFDRVSSSGALQSVKISTRSLEEQFPLRCNFSVNYMPPRTTVKIIMYRANLRLASGQHVVWCDVDPRNKKKARSKNSYSSTAIWDWENACSQHINARVDKSTKASEILSLFPKYTHRVRICPTIVPIDHYKWVKGVEWYLFKRILSYKEKNLEWWKQSFNILEHIYKYNGKICVKCPSNHCQFEL